MNKQIFTLALIVVMAGAGAQAADEASPGTVLVDCATCPEMVVIPAGSFQMGADRVERMRGGVMRPQGPVHTVTIPRPIAVGRYEVTNGEYRAFVAATARPAQSCRAWGGDSEVHGLNWRDPDYGRLARDNEPVVCVYWNDAVAYAEWLAAETGLPYRLLSEAEWEYAAKGGATTTWPWGENADEICAYGNVLDQDALDNPAMLKGASTRPDTAAPCRDGFDLVAPVGSFKPNGFGLYDMMGNIWEWAQDCSLKYYSTEDTLGKPVEIDGPCEKRAIRSGSWRSRVARQLPTFRGRDPEPTAYHLFGLRVARDLD
jgi:formylglycine-generating enzyme required for sulfatase activity